MNIFCQNFVDEKNVLPVVNGEALYEVQFTHGCTQFDFNISGL